uniref:UDP-N-acetylglucosamine transferase subunit ALG14 n=1 Tax=Astyanax mexicanus TaxID=7994 RepID=A0A3B1KET0_ASTMX
MWFSVMCGVFCGVLLVFIILVIRLYAVLRGARDCRPGVKGSVCVLVVAGSGGHTTEIIRLMGSLSQAYSPRHYVIADTDKMSEDKIRTFEASKVLCNGPGTCIPLCVAGLLLGILGLKRVLLVYVESICRVESLSLSGKILYHLSDYFFVQWQPLQTKYPKSIYMGRIV